VGTPLAIFERPETAFVATFTGAANLWDAEILGAAGEGRIRLRLAIGSELVVESSGGASRPGGAVRLALRPEKLALREPARPPVEPNVVVLPVIVEDRVYQGARTVWFVRDAAGDRRTVHQNSAAPAGGHVEPDLQPGSRALLCWEAQHAVLLRR
jgi:ABC-type Fe3+/spermidine/putrescine transport system ATPase subunit